MRIGIVELMPIGHYTLVDSVARIYLSDPSNEVIIFTNKNAVQHFSRLAAENKSSLKIQLRDENQKITDFFRHINAHPLDILYFSTLEINLAEFFHFNFNAPCSLVIHNIDDWFNLKLRKLIYRFSHGLNPDNIIYKFKTCFIQSYWKIRIVKKMVQRGSKFVVLNSILKTELSAYADPDSIEVIPFSVFDVNIKDTSNTNSKIRICIPGMVESIRRDYLSLLTIFGEESELFKNAYELDLLGPLKLNKDGKRIKSQADLLIKQGMEIHYYIDDYIPLDKYDFLLSKSNLILGNLNVQINKYSSYGKTKESGIVYTMIRMAKPGILPAQYPLMHEIESSVLNFKTYSELKIILKDIANKPQILQKLTENAKINSLNFTPSNILKTII
jgi:hypothetical protein